MEYLIFLLLGELLVQIEGIEFLLRLSLALKE